MSMLGMALEYHNCLGLINYLAKFKKPTGIDYDSRLMIQIIRYEHIHCRRNADQQG